MAITLAVGTVVAYASTYGASVAMSAISNASEAVATLAGGHGVVVGDYLEVTSGWDRLNARIVRAKVVATNDITFESVNTVSTTNFPAGTGTGSIRRITAWTNLSQLTSDIATSGGDINFADITTLVDTIRKQIPTQRNPQSVTLPGYYDATLSWFAGVTSISDSATATGFRMSFPNSNKLVAKAYWSLNPVPSISDSTLRSQIDVTFAAAPIVYTT
jgi:hypothetical protein